MYSILWYLRLINAGLPKSVTRHHNLHLHPQINCLLEDGKVEFVDSSFIIADSLIYCTGYNYSNLFLDMSRVVTVDNNYVGLLYEHTIPPTLAPELSFVSVPKKVIVPRFYKA